MIKYISEINKQGYVVIDNVLKKSQTNKFKKILERILIERANKKIDVGSKFLVIQLFFRR